MTLPRSTHDVRIEGDRVFKTFIGTTRGEPDREWQALHLLNDCLPGLAPAPIERVEHVDSTTVIMSRVEGQRLDDQDVVSPEQLGAIREALHAMAGVVEMGKVRELPPRIGYPSEGIPGVLKALRSVEHFEVPEVLSAAASAGLKFLASDRGQRLLSPKPEHPIFARGDSNIGNFLWDDGLLRVLDLEDSGYSTLAFELADLVEHLGWRRFAGDAHEFFSEGLNPEEQDEYFLGRQYCSIYWLSLLVPGGPGVDRNPTGTAELQAARVLSLVAEPGSHDL